MDHLAPPVGADDGLDLPPPASGAACAPKAVPDAGRVPITADGPSPAGPVVSAPDDEAAVWPALTSLATALSGASVWRLADEDLVARVRDFEGVRARLEAHRLCLLRELDTRGWAARVGATCTQAWLAQAVRCDPRAEPVKVSV